jgi:hypothetical protein
MTNRLIGYRYCVDQARRPIYEDAKGQYVLNNVNHKGAAASRIA